MKEAVRGLYLRTDIWGVRGVDVDVGAIIVGVFVDVQTPSLQVPKHLRSKEDQHDAHAKLEYRSDGLVLVQDHLLKQQDDYSQPEERGCMPKAPGPPDPDAPPGVAVFADYGRNGHNVVGIRSMLEAQQEAEGKGRQYTGF